MTDEGVIAADPIALANPRAANLFKTVIATVTDQPVRYLILSHGNPDHAAGADVFADTATIVGTQRAADKLIALNSPRHLPPTLIVNDYMRLELGGKVVDLYAAGPVWGGDHVFLHYPAAASSSSWTGQSPAAPVPDHGEHGKHRCPRDHAGMD